MDRWHVHAKDTEQRACPILHSRRLPLSCPGHAFPGTNRGDGRFESQDCLVNVSNRGKLKSQVSLCLNPRPVCCKEHHILRRDELLQSPATRKPLALTQPGAETMQADSLGGQCLQGRRCRARRTGTNETWS
jgi:hypothetical protein